MCSATRPLFADASIDLAPSSTGATRYEDVIGDYTDVEAAAGFATAA